MPGKWSLRDHLFKEISIQSLKNKQTKPQSPSVELPEVLAFVIDAISAAPVKFSFCLRIQR